MRPRFWLAVAALSGVLATAAPVIKHRGVRSAGTAASLSGVARGSAFVIDGTDLGPEYRFKGGIPLNIDVEGVRVWVRQVEAPEPQPVPIVEVSKTRIVAVMPSTLEPGDYEVIVQHLEEISEPEAVRVQDRNPGIVTNNVANATMATAFAGDSPSYQMSFMRPVVAGQVVAIDAAGFGPADDDIGFPGEQQKLDGLIVVVGGIEVSAQYAGRIPDRPGFDRVIFQVPENGIAPSCVVPIWLKWQEYLSEPASLAIGTSANAPCEHPGGFGLISLMDLDAGRTVIVPAFQIHDETLEVYMEEGNSELNVKLLVGGFYQMGQEGVERNGHLYFPRYSKNGCQVMSYDSQPLEFDEIKPLDAGEKLLVTGPDGLRTEVPRMEQNTYSLTLSHSGFPDEDPDNPEVGATNIAVIPGGYKLEGAGGTDIGLFQAPLDVNAPVNWINRNDLGLIDRESDLLIEWTPGLAEDLVTITGVSGYAVPSTEPDEESRVLGYSFVCQSNADRGSMTVPAEVLRRLPQTFEVENMFSVLILGHESRVPNGNFRTATTTGRVTELGRMSFQYNYVKPVALK